MVGRCRCSPVRTSRRETEHDETVIDAIRGFVGGFQNSYDFSNRDMNVAKFFGRAINQGYIERRTWCDGTPLKNPTEYRLTEKGKAVAYEIYGNPSPDTLIARMIETGW